MSASITSIETVKSNKEREAICAFVAHRLLQQPKARGVFLLKGEPTHFGDILDNTLLVVVSDEDADAYYELCRNRPVVQEYDIADSPTGSFEFAVFRHAHTSELAETEIGLTLSDLAATDSQFNLNITAATQLYAALLQMDVPFFMEHYELLEELNGINLVLVRETWKEAIDELVTMESISAETGRPLQTYDRVTFSDFDLGRAVTEAMAFDPEMRSFVRMN